VGDGDVPIEYLQTTDLSRGDRSPDSPGGSRDSAQNQERNVVVDRKRFVHTSLSKLAGYTDEAIEAMLAGRWSTGSRGSQYNTAWCSWVDFVYSQGFRCCFFPRAAVANYLAQVMENNNKRAKPLKTAVQTARTAISVTYNAAFEVDLLQSSTKDNGKTVAPGKIGNVQYYVNLKAQLSSESDSNFPVHGPDYLTAHDYWVSKGPNDKLSLGLLVDKVIQLGRFKGFRGVDLHSFPAGSEAPVPPKPPQQYGEVDFLKIAFKGSKGRKGKGQRLNNGYTVTVQIYPLRRDKLVLWMSRTKARQMSELCCFVRALGELRYRMLDIARVYFRDGKPPILPRAPTGATPLLPHLLPFSHMSVKPDMVTGSRSSDELQFLRASTINERARKIHERQYGEGTCGRGKPFSAAYYRHTSAQMYHQSGAIDARKLRLTQTEPDALFKEHYSKVPVHPDFAKRLQQLPKGVLDQLSADERLLI
jgi:hypothetical protein